MKSSVLLVIVVVIIAALSLFAYNQYLQGTRQSLNSHVYLGAIYSGNTEYGDQVSATISFTQGRNLENKIYYVVLSVWDSNRSYDQVGLSSLNGTFFSTYSYTFITKNGTIHYRYDPHWFLLRPGNHQVSMKVADGDVTFTVDGRSFVAYTGGNYFIISRTEVIGNASYSGFTVYEEIYKFDGSLPGISYNFTGVSYSTNNLTNPVNLWAHFSHNISISYDSLVFALGNTVNIYNSKPLSLGLQVVNYRGAVQINVSDLSLTISGNGKYYLYLLPGNYTVSVSYQGGYKNYTVLLTQNYTLSIQP
ncbi:MAG: hypothetical protein ACP5UO_01900 [Thermoplasmata archaeon]